MYRCLVVDVGGDLTCVRACLCMSERVCVHICARVFFSVCLQQILRSSIKGSQLIVIHDVKHFPGYWPFVQGIHQSPVNSPHKGQ